MKKETVTYLSLYSEDFESLNVWEQICDVVNVDSTIVELRIYFEPSNIVTIERSVNTDEDE